MKFLIIQIPYDSGKYNERMGAGPLALANQGFMDWLKTKGYDIRFKEVKLPNEFTYETSASKYIHGNVKSIIEDNKDYLPVVFAGNCNYAAFGIMSALNSEKTGILWFDAHGDFNTPETSASGFFDGMALSALSGNSWLALTGSMQGFNHVPEENIFLIGARDLDAEEALLLKNSKITKINIEDLYNKPLDKTFSSALINLQKNIEQVYMHVDLDVLDSSSFKANQYAAPNGLKPDELLEIILNLKKIFNIAALSFTAYDPSFDPEHRADKIVKSILNSL